MRTLCPNLDREDALETVLEVPIPEEIFATSKNSPWHSMKTWVKSQYSNKSGANNNNSVIFGSKSTEIQLLLGVVGAPLVPQAICSDHSFFSNSFRNHPIEASMAKYIVKQYIAAAGGENALNSIDSMYAMGKVKIATTEVVAGDGLSSACTNNSNLNSPGKAAAVKMKSVETAGEMGGFVLWQKKPDLWSLELVVSGCKISAGSDGKVAWRQTPWHHSHASRGPPRPLRRSVQGVDPRSTAKLFSNSICTGEKSIKDEDCFVLKLEVDSSSLKSRSSRTVEILRHTVYGYFSQRTGLLIQLEDTHLLRIKSPGNDVFWETTMESSIHDYRTIDGVNIAHSGKTIVTLFRFGENSDEHTRTRMEEVWSIVEVDFNIKGLSVDCFLPPADLKRDDEEYGVDVRRNALIRNSKSPFKIQPNNNNNMKYTMCATKVVAIDEDVEVIEAHEGFQ